MKEIEGKVSTLDAQLQRLACYLQALPKEESDEARAQLRNAVEVGVALGQMEHVPLHLPVSQEGVLQLGPELRAHLKRVRELHAEIEDLRDRVGVLLASDAEGAVHLAPRDARLERTNGSAAEYGLAM